MEKAAELRKQKSSYSHITKPSIKKYVCDKCGMKMGARGKGLHIIHCKGYKNFCLECGSIIWWYRQFCSIRCSMFFRTRSKNYLKIMSEVKKKSLMDNPESHPSRILAGTGRSKEVISGPQRKLYNIVKSLYKKDNVTFNHPVCTKSTVRYVDVALVDRMIGFEFDGVYWHKLREEKDKIRNQELKERGWTIYHFSEQDDMEAKVKLCSEEVIVHGTVGRKK